MIDGAHLPPYNETNPFEVKLIMKKFFNALFFSKTSAVILTALAALSIIFLYCATIGNVIPGSYLFNFGAMALVLLAIADTAVLFALSVFRMKNPEIYYKKSFRTVSCLAELGSVALSIAALVSLAISGAEGAPVVLRHVKAFFPLWCAVFGFVCLIFIIPLMKNKTAKKLFSSVMALALAVTVYASFFPVSPYKFTSGPVVFDNGTEYSVVFTTNDKGTAYIEYAYNGETVRIYDQNNGRKNGDSIIHTIKVPYEQLSENTYKVGSTRVIQELSYGGRNGKSIESEPITFHDDFGDAFNILTVSDWHTRNDLAQHTAGQLGTYSAVILLGDSAPALMYPEETAEYIVAFGADLTEGTMPVLFARGNHETRGRAASQLSEQLGIDCFYYTAKLGAYNFIVLDSGEDKDDSHREYGDMVVYGPYREAMISWLQTLENTSLDKTIALSHADEICIEEDLSAAAKAKLDSLNTSLLVSGHLHKSVFKTEGSFPTLIDGGVNAAGKGTYVASMLSVSPNGIRAVSIDNTGNKTVEETVAWR